ncbi:MAG: glycoside hydrolase family 3 C-terminal domain-containing protein [Candidatus Delongbacteria bacterium]|nr:glycoside hydrolase family 3 C-terminal domain-containing protein [Candidatus Delongbacteria bacterium]MBN2836802.1 glycoside hydrolase family 3 C-terminal domain-containing protein [Candidatus Delongbacteria bacterium]
MTVEEKFWQLFMIPGDLSDGKENYKNGIFGFQVDAKGSSENEAEQILDYSEGSSAEDTAKLINKIQKYFVEETRLGIPIIPFDEVLHGLIRKGATVFPQAIGLAATWNIELMREVSQAIAKETKSRGIRQVLSPVLNIARDVRWGRTEETYGEDPYLTTCMAQAFVESFEENNIITTPKHFAANVGDGGRDSYPIHHNDRLFEEIYFPAFKACIEKSGSRSIMTAYNSVDGRQCTANDWLLNQKLKQDWNFEGFVITDAGAVGGADVLHNTASGFEDATVQSFTNGLDVIFQTAYQHYPLFITAFTKGLIDENRIDDAVSRVLKAKFELGLFENPYVDPAEAKVLNNCKEHRELSKRAALESIVLLKNENKILPVKRDVSSIAVIGSDAIEARLGGYSGPGNNPVSILHGIKSKIGNSCNIKYSKGCTRNLVDFTAIPEEYFFHDLDGIKQEGLIGEYFNNIKLDGNPEITRIDMNIDFRWTLFSPDPDKINFDYFSARWTGKIKSPETGCYKIGVDGDDGYRVYIDGELIIDNWRKQTYQTIVKDFYFEKDREYDVKVEFYESSGNVKFKLIWNIGVENNYSSEIDEAVKVSKECDYTIVCVGIEEGEFRDRALLNLPGNQEELILKIAELGKPVVVILIGGSAITMGSWINSVDGLLDVWYSGDEGGNAIADVFFGDYNPAGRLPITFPIHEGQLPLYYNHKPTGRGDDYDNLSGKPLFPFGFGLSYSSFLYEDMEFNKEELLEGEKLEISFNLTNIGEHDGDEVVQLYIKDVLASVARPVKELKGFKRVHLLKGKSKRISFILKYEEFSLLNEQMEKVVEPGDFRILIGASSSDIRLRKILRVK